MAAFPSCYKTPNKDQNLPTQSLTRQNDKRFMYDCDNMLRSMSSIPGQICRPSNRVNNIFTKSSTRDRNAPRCMIHCSPRDSSHKAAKKVSTQGCYSRRGGNNSTVWCSADSSSIEKQLSSLDSYFAKLQDDAKLGTADTSNEAMAVVHQRDGQSGSKNGLESLDEYLGKLNNGKVLVTF